MQLVHIGEIRERTVLDMVLEMARRQAAEIDQLKASARAQSAAKRGRSRCRSRITRPR